MTLHQYLAAVRKGWWLILIALIVGVASGFVVSARATPQYAGSVTFFISTPTEGGTSPLAADQFATRRITSYVGLLSSDVTAQRVLKQTGLNLTAAQIRAKITGEADLNTVLLTATVTDSSPDRALQILQAIAAQFGIIVNEVDPIGPDNVVLRVITGPTVNPNPVSPRTVLNLGVGLAVGLAVGVALAVLRVLLDTTVRQPQLLRDLTQAPVLGIIPFDKAAGKSPLVVNATERSIRAEALRQLRTNLQFVDVERPLRLFVVTSSVAMEGKSTTAANLAVAFSESGKTVLLIEADLRRPRVADYLGLERAVGLTNVLADQVNIDKVLQPWGNGQLRVLTSGSIPPNPSELLGSPKMQQLLERLKRSFDLIIIDTPPLLPVTDAAVVAAYADGAVLVVRYGKTTRAQVSSAASSLKSVEGRLLGTILNMSPKRGSDGYARYGYGGHYENPSSGTNAKFVEHSLHSDTPSDTRVELADPLSQPHDSAAFNRLSASSSRSPSPQREMRLSPGRASRS